MDVDGQPIEQFLKKTYPDFTGEFQIEKTTGGQSNPTYVISIGNRPPLVLRRRPDGDLLPSAHSVAREFRVQKALEHTRVKVPEMILHSEDISVAGTEFYLMSYIPGRIFHDNTLKAALPSERKSLYFAMARMLANIHAVNIHKVGLDSFGKHGNYFMRQIDRWSRQWQLSTQSENNHIDYLAAWLKDNIPDNDETALVHGDYRIGNLVYDSNTPSIAAVLDWELSTLGNPMADLANCCAYAWFLNSDEYGKGIRNLNLAEHGLPSIEEFVEVYQEESRCKEKLTSFHLSFALFRMAVIFTGVADRARRGNAASGNAFELGKIAPRLVQRAVELTKREIGGISNNIY